MNGMLTCLENQAKRADEKESKHYDITHQSEIKKKVQHIRAMMKSQKKYANAHCTKCTEEFDCKSDLVKHTK